MNISYVSKLEVENTSSYCVMCINDGNILDSYNADKTQSVASISKVMTAIVAIENGNLKEKVIVDAGIYECEGSSLYLKENDVYTLEDLIYGLMLRSGNDAAYVIAKHVFGSVDVFVEKMNEKAKSLKMYSTIFNNPSGLDEKDGGNISSSCDMAKLMQYAMQNEIFKKITATQTYKTKNNVWHNKNKFLKQYAYATGGKTGYTKKAGRTLITTSKQNDMEVVVVTLNKSDDFNFHTDMHTRMYELYDVVKIMKKGKYVFQNKTIYIQNDIYQTIFKNNKKQIKIQSSLDSKYFTVLSSHASFKKQYQFEVTYE